MRTVLLACLVMAGWPSAVAAQHPCDRRPSSMSVEAVAGHGQLQWCAAHVDTRGRAVTVTGWAVYIDGQRIEAPLSIVTVGPPNKQGFKLHTTEAELVAGSDVVRVRIAAITAAGEGDASPERAIAVVTPGKAIAPFVLGVQ